MTEEKAGLITRTFRYILVVVLLLAFVVFATYAVMSDTSIHGLTIRFYTVSWNCTGGSSYSLVTFDLNSVSVYSSASLTTSLSHVTFSMSWNGFEVGTVNAHDSSFGPGQSAAYNLAFSNPTIDPGSQPLSGLMVLAINAQVSAGVYSSQVASSYSQTVRFSSRPC